MPGYSVEWKHKAPATVLNKESVLKHHVIEPIVTKGLRTLPTPAVKWTSPALKAVNQYHSKNVMLTHIASGAKKPAVTTAIISQNPKGQPHFYTGDEQEDDHARKSLVYGILSLGSPATGFLIMLGIVLSVGSTLANPAGYALAIFIVSCAGGLTFAVLALISGFLAINEINADPDTYSGKGEAITGMVLAIVALLGFVGYIVVRLLS